MTFNQLGFFFWTGAYLYTDRWIFIITAVLHALLVMVEGWEDQKRMNRAEKLFEKSAQQALDAYKEQLEKETK